MLHLKIIDEKVPMKIWRNKETYFNNVRKINTSLIPVLIFTVDDGKKELEILDGE